MDAAKLEREKLNGEKTVLGTAEKEGEAAAKVLWLAVCIYDYACTMCIIYIYIYVCMFIYMCVRVCIYIYIYICSWCVNLYAYIHVNIYAHIHAYIHTLYIHLL